jgi:Spy/CpxP family protein refolding chaperone
MKIKTMLLTLTAAGILFSGQASAAPETQDIKAKNPEWAQKMKEKREGFFKELGLTDEQKKALEAHKDQHRKEMKELVQSMRDQMKQMREELQKDKLDMGKINQIQSQLKTTQAQMMDHRLQGILEVRKILTPDQFKKFSEKMEEGREHWGGHKGGHWGMMGGGHEPSGDKDAKE